MNDWSMGGKNVMNGKGLGNLETRIESSFNLMPATIKKTP